MTVVGLGPGGVDLITAGTLEAIAATSRRFTRTDRHPAVAAIGEHHSFDSLYESADRLEDVYAAIVERLADECAEAGDDTVLYAVPGSPLVAEQSVRLLLVDTRFDVEVLPALSFLDLLWVRLGVDPLEVGASVVDGHRFAVDAAGRSGPLVVCQCDSPPVLSDIKLAIEDWPDRPVTVVQRLGLPDERIEQVEWADLDRIVEADHLTTLWIPELATPIARELIRFEELVRDLRVGCPWDREQTHQSLKRYALEETYELLESIDALGHDPSAEAIDDFAEELGDVLFQVFFHSTIAAESGWFTLADVAAGVTDKLRDRHPHVFGDATFDSVEDLTRRWEAAKVAEKGRASVFDGIPSELPALLLAWKVQKKAATLHGAGAEAEDTAVVVGRFAASPDADTLGSLLWSVVSSARTAGLDPEDALRVAARRVIDDLT